MRKGRLAVVTVFGSLAVGLAACTVLSGRVYNSVLYDIVPWLVTVSYTHLTLPTNSRV